LDVSTRDLLGALLHKLHLAHQPRFILGLRAQDPIPDWITHVARVESGRVFTEEKTATFVPTEIKHSQKRSIPDYRQGKKAGDVVVDMRNVRVSYSDRHVGLICWLIMTYLTNHM
jgi:hypothetical protein